jgi:alanyl-tRNA synthetase
VGREELARIENEVNAKVLDGAMIACENLPLAAARKAGATMLFGEKYPDVVRVVSMGDFSKELCGGTHLTNTGQVGLFKIIGEESVAAGTRRITALTGPRALERISRNEAALAKTAAALKVPVEDVPDRVAALAKEVRQLRKQAAAGPNSEGATADALLKGAKDMGGVRVVIAEVADAGADALRALIDQLRRKGAPIAVMLGNRGEEGKVTLMAGLSRDLVEKGLDAVRWVRQVAKLVEGGGGGRPDLAQAGGKNADKLPEALAAARALAEEMLG